jgi:diketogulonate reductase-like aldo/keto reductase
MERRPLGRTGLDVAPLCLGAMNFGDPTDADEAARMIDTALDGGIDMIDVADVYAGGASEPGGCAGRGGHRDPRRWGSQRTHPDHAVAYARRVR